MLHAFLIILLNRVRLIAYNIWKRLTNENIRRKIFPDAYTKLRIVILLCTEFIEFAGIQ